MSIQGDRSLATPAPTLDDLRPSWPSVVAELVVLGVGLWLASEAIDRFGPKLTIPKLGAAHGGPSPSSVGGLIASAILALICAAYAIWKRSVYLTVVIGAASYGLFVEFFNLTVFKTYVYGDSYFMIFGKVPLMIVLSWGAIIYSAMRTSDSLDLKWYLKPIYDGMLGLTIDLALDPVAVSVGLWKWEINAQGMPPVLFLGIPLANFYGWFMLVLSYSLVVRAGLRYCPAWVPRDWVGAVVSTLAIPCAFVVFSVAMLAYGALVNFLSVPESLAFSLLLGSLVLLILVYLTAADHDDAPNLVSLASPLLIHAYLMIEYYFAGLWRPVNAQGVPSTSDGLIIMLPMIAAFSVISFSWPFLDGIKVYFTWVRRLADGRGDLGRGIDPG